MTSNIKSLSIAVDEAKDWFLKSSIKASKSEWDQRNCAAKRLRNIVYAFFDSKGGCIYVGVSKAELSKRVHYVTSPHRLKPWWKKWQTVQVLAIENETDRLTLEILLIIGLGPNENKKPAQRDIRDMFPA